MKTRLHFHVRMPKTTTQNCVDRSAKLEAAVAPANVLIVNPNSKPNQCIYILLREETTTSLS